MTWTHGNSDSSIPTVPSRDALSTTVTSRSTEAPSLARAPRQSRSSCGVRNATIETLSSRTWHAGCGTECSTVNARTPFYVERGHTHVQSTGRCAPHQYGLRALAISRPTYRPARDGVGCAG